MTEHTVIRRAGLLIPLFSCPSTRSWGIGEIGDVEPVTAWLGGAGLRVWQLLPLNAVAIGEQSPYAALSAMAIDPIYIEMAAVEDFAALGGEAALDATQAVALESVRHAPSVDYPHVRQLKGTALALAFDRFHAQEWRHESARAQQLAGFIASQRWWLDDYALFRAIADREPAGPWTAWPHGLRRRDRDAIAQTARDLARAVLFHQYVQWVAEDQWQSARMAARAHGVALFGDLPFMVGEHSADVWVRQAEFALDVSLGVPPDAFSDTGQDWGMPVYRWSTGETTGYQWQRARARRSADLYDGYRVDHLVGFYRTYGRPRDGGAPFFSPEGEQEQTALGEQMLRIFLASGADIVAEDLGVIPDFVRVSLERMRVPGYRVMRWERHWEQDGQPFRDPEEYPVCAVATTGTHDTETMAQWWSELSLADRERVSAMTSVQRLIGGRSLAGSPFNPGLRDALLEALIASPAAWFVAPIQDVFGWTDRINVPATVTPTNWTFKLPWPSDWLADVSEARERQQTLRGWCERYRRVP